MQCRATRVPPAPWGAAKKSKGAARSFEKYLKLLGFFKNLIIDKQLFSYILYIKSFYFKYYLDGQICYSERRKGEER